MYCSYQQTDQSHFRVKLGGQDIGTQWDANEDSQQVLNIEKWILHENYNHDTTSHDIALLKLSQTPVVNDFVKPICLGQPTNILQPNDMVIVAGWGTTYGEKAESLVSFTL